VVSDKKRLGKMARIQPNPKQIWACWLDIKKKKKKKKNKKKKQKHNADRSTRNFAQGKMMGRQGT